MSRRRITMRRIKEMLRYHFEGRLSNERIGRALGLSKGSVYNILHRFKRSKLSWPLPQDLTDSELEKHLYPSNSPADGQLPSISYLDKELNRKHVTLQLLWEEYQQSHPNSLSRASFYRYYQKNSTRPVTMKMHHKSGDKLFVDYSGDSLEYIDRTTGEIVKTQLFVASWGASSYTYAEVTHSQQREDFISSHVRAFKYFGVVPHALVPDNLKSGVKKAHRYDPEINPLYAKLAKHYNTVVLPARSGKPRDKAVVESNVLNAQRFLLGRLRNQHFFSITEINNAISLLLDELNTRGMKDYGGQSRKERFEEYDRPNAKPLKKEHFKISLIKIGVRVAPNYHIRFKDHYYSVPHHLARKSVDIYQVGHIIEIYYDSNHVCRYQRSWKKFGYTTKPEHMPPEHSFVNGWSPEWFMSQANDIGPNCALLIKEVMRKQEHVQQGFNAALGILRLSRVYTAKRLEAASARACKYKSYSSRALKSILDKNLDKVTGSAPQQTALPIVIKHENIRGSSYYQN